MTAREAKILSEEMNQNMIEMAINDAAMNGKTYVSAQRKLTPAEKTELESDGFTITEHDAHDIVHWSDVPKKGAYGPRKMVDGSTVQPIPHLRVGQGID